MCILFIANNMRLEYPLIVAANRDEFFARPSSAAHFWKDTPDLLAGRDEQAGGAWLGVNRQGQFAAVTNFRIPSKVNSIARSRGDLVVNYLIDKREQDFCNNLESEFAEYNPFNLVVGNVEKLSVFSSEAPGFKDLNPGCHPICNGLPDDDWPKMSCGTSALRSYLEQASEVDVSYLVDLLHDSTRAAYDELPNTGIGDKLERALSSVFIDTQDLPAGKYGTRTSTVVLFDNKQINFY